MNTWQRQDVQKRMDEVMDKAQSEGPQFITENGADVAVVVSAEEYQRLVGPQRTLADLLLGGPKFDDFEIPPRRIDPPRDLNMDDEGDGVAAE